MSVKIGLISDVHATPGPLREALALVRREGARQLLCAGDIAGYGSELESTVELLKTSGCRAVLGNHDLWFLEGGGVGAAADYLRALPLEDELSVSGVRLGLVHGSPADPLMGGIRLLDERGALVPAQLDVWCERLRDLAAEVLVVGHTHQVFAEQLGTVLVINPGSTRFNHSCALLSLPELEVRFFPLGGRDILPAWNWGMERRGPAAGGAEKSG